MKNFIITVLVFIVLGFGGWMVYSKIASDDSPAGNSTTSGQTSTNGKTLDLSNKGLTEVGPDIYDRTDVTKLVLSNNNLKSLKSEMGRMTKLEVLLLDHNSLEGSLIGEIHKMPLKTLDASYNNMTGMPAEMSS